MLVPLTARFDPQEHDVYLNALEDAVAAEDPPNCNIALTGSYGSGKSSILNEFVSRHPKRVISVSLSTLGASERLSPEDEHGSVSGTTNRIQKEIVKQLLHSRDPTSTPGSRYRRTTRFRLWRELPLAAFVAVPLTLVAMLAGWTTKIWTILSGQAPNGRWVHLVALATVTLFILGARHFLHNRYQIDQITAGATTITLSTGSGTYFDEYLDEIMYLFEGAKRDIVVFEDIDRFDEAEVFETLRTLNTTLNSAQQLRGRTVRFVYAIKDSIFDELARNARPDGPDSPKAPAEGEEAPPRAAGEDAARAELARANRTKFFDLIIPVVPFLTHRSARDLVAATMNDIDHGVSAELIDVAARHVADMRLIKDIRNEFTIFRQRVMTAGDLELTDDALFAMILYKTTHLSDFEAIRLGSSDLDEVYRASRELVETALSTLGERLRALRRELTHATLTADHAEQLGHALMTHLNGFTAVVGLPVQSYSFSGQTLDTAQAQNPEFWRELAKSDTAVEITVTSGPQYYSESHRISLNREYLSRELGVPIAFGQWAKERRADLLKQIEETTADRDFLAHADMGDLLKEPCYTLERPGGSYSLRQIAGEHLRSEMAMDLLAAGYIDRNFTLYTATFHAGRVSARAMNYIIKNVERGTIDMHYILKSGDVETLMREHPRFLEEPSAYNLHVLDSLLEAGHADLDVLVRRLVRFGPDERTFLLAYVESGHHQVRLVKHLAPLWPGIFPFLLTDASLEGELQLTLVDAALSSVAGSVEYEVGADLARVLEDHGGELGSLTSEPSSSERVEYIVKIVLGSGAVMPDLGSLGGAQRLAIAAVGAFQVNRANLEVALESAPSLALDDLARSHRGVYQRCLTDLSGYLSALRQHEVSIINPKVFPAVIDDVLEAAPDSLDAVVASASTNCIVQELQGVAVAAWPVLASRDRITLTLATIARYLEEICLDEPLGQLLERSGVELADDDEDVKRTVAGQLLAGATVLSSPAVRADLVASLGLEEPLTPSMIPHEQGDLLALLLQRNLVEDGPGAFTTLLAEDWSGRDAAIAASPGFADFVTQQELPLAYVEHFLASDVVPVATKDVVVGRFIELTEGATSRILSAVASHALQRSLPLPFGDVQRLAHGRARPDLVIGLLQPHLRIEQASEVLALLRVLGGTYTKLTERNGKHPRLPKTAHNRSLLTWLEEQSLVNSYREAEDTIHIHMKR